MKQNPEQPAPSAESNDPRTASDKAVVCKELLEQWADVTKHLPRIGKLVLLHFAWGETNAGWCLADGKFQTASQPIPQGVGDVTHWMPMPLGPHSPPECEHEWQHFICSNISSKP